MGGLELGKDTVPQMKMVNFFRRIGSKPITYENASPLRKRALLSEMQGNYVQDIIVTIDTANLGMSRRDAIQVISYIGQANSYVQAENHLDYLIQEELLPDLKRYGRATKSKATTMERSHICLSQQYRWHMMIDAEWEYLQNTNSPCDIFTHFSHCFQSNLDETSFLCNESELKVIRVKKKTPP